MNLVFFTLEALTDKMKHSHKQKTQNFNPHQPIKSVGNVRLESVPLLDRMVDDREFQIIVGLTNCTVELTKEMKYVLADIYAIR